MASGTTFGNLRVTVQADTSKFSKGIKKAQKDLTLFQKTTRALSGNMAKLMGGLGIGLTGGALVKGFMDTAAAIDETAKAARNLGVETEAFIGLRHAADLSGLSVSALESGLKAYTRATLDASRGMEAAVENFAALGLEASSLMKLRLDDQMSIVATRLSQVTNETERAALRMKLFGRAGSEMGVLMEQGGDGIRKMVKEADELGLVFSAEEAKKLETFNDEMSKLKQIVGGAWRNFVIDISQPAIDTVKALQEVVQGTIILAQQTKATADAAGLTQGRAQTLGKLTNPLASPMTGIGAVGMLANFMESRINTWSARQQGLGGINDQDRAEMQRTRDRNAAEDELRKNTAALQENNNLIQQSGLPQGAPVAGPATATIMK